jgi:REP element-mobilizing transposase RayT
MRPPRIYKEDTVYYITAGASGRELLFQDESDYKEFLEILKTRKVKYNFKLYAYCLVPQHYYFLIEPQAGSASISKIMQAINTSYSLYFNKKYGRIGHLIGGRFESRMFNKDAALLEQTVNMHLTPWQLKATTKLEDYKWSSYTEYIQADRQEFLTDKEFIFSFLDTTDKEAQVNKYKELIEQRKTEIATEAKETEEATGVSLSGETEQSFFNYRLGYILLAVALVGSLVILPNFLGRKVNKYTLGQALNKEADVNLPEGLAFYPAHRPEKKVWELWKLGPWNKLGEANELAQ